MRHWRKVRELISSRSPDAPEAADSARRPAASTLAPGLSAGVVEPEEGTQRLPSGKRWAERSGDVKADGLLRCLRRCSPPPRAPVEVAVRHAHRGPAAAAPDRGRGAAGSRSRGPPSIVVSLCAGQFPAIPRTPRRAARVDARDTPSGVQNLWQISASVRRAHCTRGTIEIFVGNFGPRRPDRSGCRAGATTRRSGVRGWALAWLGRGCDRRRRRDRAGAVPSGASNAEKIGSPYSRAAAYYRLGITLTVAG